MCMVLKIAHLAIWSAIRCMSVNSFHLYDGAQSEQIGGLIYAGDTEDTSVLLVDTEDSSSPRGLLPQKRVFSMQLRNCE